MTVARLLQQLKDVDPKTEVVLCLNLKSCTMRQRTHTQDRGHGMTARDKAIQKLIKACQGSFVDGEVGRLMKKGTLKNDWADPEVFGALVFATHLFNRFYPILKEIETS